MVCSLLAVFFVACVLVLVVLPFFIGWLVPFRGSCLKELEHTFSYAVLLYFCHSVLCILFACSFCHLRLQIPSAARKRNHVSAYILRLLFQELRYGKRARRTVGRQAKFYLLLLEPGSRHGGGTRQGLELLEARDRAGDLQIFSLTLSQLSCRGSELENISTLLRKNQRHTHSRNAEVNVAARWREQLRTPL